MPTEQEIATQTQKLITEAEQETDNSVREITKHILWRYFSLYNLDYNDSNTLYFSFGDDPNSVEKFKGFVNEYNAKGANIELEQHKDYGPNNYVFILKNTDIIKILKILQIKPSSFDPLLFPKNDNDDYFEFLKSLTSYYDPRNPPKLDQEYKLEKNTPMRGHLPAPVHKPPARRPKLQKTPLPVPAANPTLIQQLIKNPHKQVIKEDKSDPNKKVVILKYRSAQDANDAVKELQNKLGFIKTTNITPNQKNEIVLAEWRVKNIADKLGKKYTIPPKELLKAFAFDIDEFRKQYENTYKNKGWNPSFFRSSKIADRNGNVYNTVDEFDIVTHAYNNPKSRTAAVLRKMLNDPQQPSPSKFFGY